MCVGPPASTMNLPWQTETGPLAPLKHCQTLWPQREAAPLSSSILPTREREGGMSERTGSEWTALSCWGYTYFDIRDFFLFSAKTSLFPTLFSAATVWSFKESRIVFIEADCKICLLASCCGFMGLVGKKGDFYTHVKTVELNEIKFLHISLSRPFWPLRPVFKRCVFVLKKTFDWLRATLKMCSKTLKNVICTL